MTEREFQTNMTGADTFRSLLQTPESDFWDGYRGGEKMKHPGDCDCDWITESPE